MNRLKRFLRSDWGSLIALVLLLLAGRSSLADHYYVPSGSMEYSLMPGDRVIVDKTAYGLRLPFTKLDLVDVRRPQPGEIVVFDSPTDGKLLIKRIVAIGGDRVDLLDGHLTVNGIPLTAPDRPLLEAFADRIAQLNLEHGGGPDIRGFELPEGTVLALGDHRGSSHDSRYFGPVAEREIYGRAIAIYYSREEGFRWHKL